MTTTQGEMNVDFTLIVRAVKAALAYSGVVQCEISRDCQRVELYVVSICNPELRFIGFIRF